MTIFALCLVIFVDAMSLGMVLPVFAPMFTHDHGVLFAVDTSLAVRQFAYAMIVSLPMMFLIFGPPFLGYLSDNYGRKRILLVGLIGLALASLLSIFSLVIGSLFLLFLSRILVGFLDGTQAIAQAAIADVSAPDNKARNLSFITFFGAMGFTVGPVLGGFMADPDIVSWFNYHTPFYFAFALAIVNAVALQLTFRETYIPTTKQSLSYRAVIKNTVQTCFDHRLRGLSILYLAMQFCWGGYFQAISLYLVTNFDYSSSQIGGFVTYLSLIFTLSLIVLIKVLLKHFQHHRLVFVGVILIALGMMSMTIFYNHLLVVWLIVIPLTVGVAISYNVLLAMFSNAVSKTEQGKVMGATVALVAIGWLSAALLIGAFAHHLRWYFLLLGAVTLASTVFTRKALVKTPVAEQDS